MTPKKLWSLLKESFNQWWNEDRPFELAASLAYYTIFSLAPLLIIAIGIAGFFFGREAAQNEVVNALDGLVGPDSAVAIQNMIEKAGQQPDSGLVATSIGLVMLLFGAGGVVGQLQTSLNMIWGVEPKPNQGIMGFLRARFVSYSMVLGIGFLLLVSLLVSAALAAFTQVLGGLMPGYAGLAHVIELLISFAFTAFLFALMFKFLPDVRIAWWDVIIGAVMTAILFTIGKSLIGLYLGQSSVTSVYGAAGSLVTILLWIYYSSLIFFFGAELTQVYASKFGSDVVPTETAQPAGGEIKRGLRVGAE